MKALLLAFALLGLSPAALTQTPPTPIATPADTPPASSAALDVAPDERRYFELGTTLAKASFAYAALAKKAAPASRSQSLDTQISRLARLTPDARRERGLAKISLKRAVTLLQELSAPSGLVASLTRLSEALDKPPVATGDAQNVTALNSDAGVVLAALQESSRLTGILENAALKKWLKTSETGQVWYVEGLMAGVSEVAVRENLPTLLPPLRDLATDLRGLRDWLSLRMPDTPSPEQTALQTAIDQFLQQSAATKRPKPFTRAQMQALGDISRMLQAQMISPPPPEAPASPTTVTP